MAKLLKHVEQDKSKKGNEKQSEVIFITGIFIIVLMLFGVIWVVIKYYDDLIDTIEEVKNFGETDYEIIERY